MTIQSCRKGRLAQLVERTLSMREVGGSKPPMSTFYSHGMSMYGFLLILYTGEW